MTPFMTYESYVPVINNEPTAEWSIALPIMLHDIRMQMNMASDNFDQKLFENGSCQPIDIRSSHGEGQNGYGSGDRIFYFDSDLSPDQNHFQTGYFWEGQ